MPEFEFKGIEELQKLINSLPELALEAAEPAMQDTMIFLHGQLPEYPPPIPDSTYDRTGTLGRRFTENVNVQQAAVIGELGTNLNYAPWVVGDDFPGSEINGVMKYQAKVHQGRWWQFNDVINENIDKAWEEFTDKFLPEFRERIEKAKAGGQ